MNAIDEVTAALVLAKMREKEAPGLEILTSTVHQLEYLLAVVTGEDNDKSRVKEVIVGHYAVREFEESDPQLARALKAAQFVASRISKGLKI